MAAHGGIGAHTGINPYTGGLNRHIENFIEGYGHPNIVLVLGRSKNLNVVVYEAMFERGVLAPEKPLDAYWLNIDPVVLEKERAKGHAEVREELGMLESMAFGVKSKPAGDGTYSITMAAIPDRVFTLSLVDGRPRLQTTISGKLAYISRAFVEAEERILLGAKTLWVDIVGHCITTGEPEYERIMP